MHGQISKGGVRPIAEPKDALIAHRLSTPIRNALDYLEALIECAPPRSIHIQKQRPMVCGWSDAEYDPAHPEAGGGLGWVLRWRDRRSPSGRHSLTHAGWARVSRTLVSTLLPRKQQIGQLEAHAPLGALQHTPDLTGVDVLWGIDNTSAQAALSRGTVS